MLITLLSSKIELFGIDIVRVDDFAELVMRFAFNFLITILLVRYIYYPKTHRRDYLFTFLLIGIIIFLMCFLLNSVKLQLGFALGLFAVFGIIRYRTDSIPIKEMTYLFMVIGISVVNALANKKVSYAELAFTNFIILGVAWFVERLKGLENESYAVVLYEKIELINPARREELLNDLESRLGVKISRVEIGIIDFQKDIVKIRAYFLKSKQSWGENDAIEFKTLQND